MPSRPISPEMLAEAKRKTTEMGILAHSFTKGRGRIVGFLGEFLANQLICGRIVSGDFNYDIVSSKLDGEVRWDVKTKTCKSPPKSTFLVSVSAYQLKQNCDRYAFCRILSDYSAGWILGWMPKAEFFEKATLFKEGDLDPSNGFRVAESCYSLAISQLNPFG